MQSHFPSRFSAMLHVHDSHAAVEFYRKAFGADVLWTAPDGGVAQFSVDGAEFWIHEQSVAYKNLGPADARRHNGSSPADRF